MYMTQFSAVKSELYQPSFHTCLLSTVTGCGICASIGITLLSLHSPSNPEVQLQVLSYGSMPLLVQLLSPTKPDLLQRRATFAISALMRGQSDAISIFLEENGIEKLSEQMDKRSLAILSKGITLISDILNTEVSAWSLCSKYWVWWREVKSVLDLRKTHTCSKDHNSESMTFICSLSFSPDVDDRV